MKNKSSRLLYIILALVSGCATPPRFNDRAIIEIGDKDKIVIPKTDFDLRSGQNNYSYDKQSLMAEWHLCSPKNSSNSSTVLFMHETHNGFESSSVCSHWMSSLLLSKGFKVLAINRPGFGKSTGDDDLAGRRTQKAIESAVTDSQQVIDSAVGLGVGSIAAAFFAKQNKNLKWLLLGNGIFDLEIVLKNTTDTKLKSSIERLKSTDGEAGFELRSIAWDPIGIPKTIGLFHNTNDTSSPYIQAANFGDQLRLAEYKVVKIDISSAPEKLFELSQYKAAKAALDQMLK